jgi:VWFA-related protein
MISEVRAVGRRLLEQLPLSEDIDLVPFNDGVERLSSFHSGRDLLEDKVDSLKAVGETALYDSLAAALEGPPTEHHDRKVIVLVTDGLDDNSRIHFQEMVDRIELKNDTTIYAVGMFDYARRPWWDRARSPEDERIERNLTRLAEISGGAAYFPKNQDEGRKAIDAIIRNVRGQYSLSYYRRPHGEVRSSSDVRVEVRPGGRNTPGLIVRSRRAFSSPGPLAGVPAN